MTTTRFGRFSEVFWTRQREDLFQQKQQEAMEEDFKRNLKPKHPLTQWEVVIKATYKSPDDDRWGKRRTFTVSAKTQIDAINEAKFCILLEVPRGCKPKIAVLSVEKVS